MGSNLKGFSVPIFCPQGSRGTRLTNILERKGDNLSTKMRFSEIKGGQLLPKLKDNSTPAH